ncbi:MAG TPA: hypothetical protein VM578_06175 [Candidatus Saccharimonadales bacterium]|nr:hypothetical protein [Candidatus Saccharimonadales bacterium]
MKCNDFDAHIDEMLSGILHPDANQHASQCERCSSHLRARANLQSSLRKLSSASPAGPSRATDRAVMESYRRLQQRRSAWNSEPVSDSAPRLLTVPPRSLVPEWTAPRSWASRTFISRTWISGAAAAALVFAVFGSAVHLWTGVGTVSAPTVNEPTVSAPLAASTPARPQSGATVAASRRSAAASNSAPRTLAANSAPRAAQPRPQSQFVASSAFRSERTDAPVFAAKAASPRSPVVYAGGQNYDSGPVTQTNASVMRLASSGASGNMAQSASSTWPGYSNLMYCDPVVCSGPMQVVHIKVPVGQVKPNLGQTMGNAFVNAEVVIGPDGVARAIRVAN